MATSDKDRILVLLKSAGSRGSTTWELITETHCSAAARRVWDLQQDGYQIEKRKEGKGVYRWIYRGEPLPPQQLSWFDAIQEQDEQRVRAITGA